VFQHDARIPMVPASREQVVALVESINQPQISIPGRPAQAVQGWLCGLRNADGSFSVYVALYLPLSAENVVYASEPRAFGVGNYAGVEQEGVQFLESMGFMLDNLKFRNMTSEVQEATLRRIPVFSRPRPAAAAGASGADQRPSLARLLANL